MGVSLGIVANIYQEANAIPGWLEMATSGFFDDVQILHAGPGGADSTDGTIELLEKWRIPIHRCAIDQGFGIVRTAAVRACKCDWVMLLDADERFYPLAREIKCEGEPDTPETVNRILQEYDLHARGQVPSNWENVSNLGKNLTTTFGGHYDQGAWLKDFLQYGSLDACATIRRHWHDFSWRRPTQNWHHIPDQQARIVRNHPSIHWDANTRMHERLIGASNIYQPNQTHGPFFDHYHLFFKRMEIEQRAFDVKVYDSLHFGHPMPSEEEFRKGREAKP